MIFEKGKRFDLYEVFRNEQRISLKFTRKDFERRHLQKMVDKLNSEGINIFCTKSKNGDVYITKNGVLKVDTSKGIDSSEDLSDLIDIVSIGE